MRFDFSARYSAAFGFQSVNFSRRLTEQGFADIIKKDNLDENSVYLWDKSTAFDEVRLYRDVDGKKEEYLFAFRSLSENYTEVFATPPMLSLSRTKKIKATPIDNSDDIEVVERYTTEPWNVDWKGLLIDMEEHEFPIDKLDRLNQIFEVNGVWNVASEILNRVGIEAIYIKDIKIDFIEGFEDTISYSIATRAIKPLEYQLLNN